MSNNSDNSATDRSFAADPGGMRVPLQTRTYDNSTRAMSIVLILGLITLPLQVAQIGIVQPGHLWMIGALATIVFLREFSGVARFELIVFLIFAISIIVLTLFQPYDRVKFDAQLVKFIFVYPGFYLVGRSLGDFYSDKPLPYGYTFLFLFLVFEYAVDRAQIPFIYKEIDFGEGTLHGTFIERNWIALYFFLSSYLLFLKSNSAFRYIPYLSLNGIVTVLSGSKTSFVACCLVILLKSQSSPVFKVAMIVVGGAFYWYLFSGDFSDDMLAVRLEEERGLAYQVSMGLISAHPLGYGVGFVEGYFSHIDIIIKGLGEGTGSVFAAPLDLAIIAGAIGLIFWTVFFLGVGLGATTYLAPIAALSLLNPLHQSEIAYIFMGMLVSWARGQIDVGRIRLIAQRDVSSVEGLPLEAARSERRSGG